MNASSTHLEKIIHAYKGIATLQVVFSDIEKYSKRKTTIQIMVINEFTACLRHALDEISSMKPHVLYAQDNSINFQTDIITVPTGDGAAIAFSFNGLLDIHLRFALALLKKVADHNAQNACDRFNEHGWCNCHPNFNLRIGVSDGSGLIYRDLNDGFNVAGEVVNTAARVMGLVGSNQIAFTENAYRRMNDFGDAALADRFGEQAQLPIKHDEVVNVYQYVDEGLDYLNSAPLVVASADGRGDATAALVERYRKIEEAGFRSIFSDRQQFFDYFFRSILPNVKDELNIMGICVSLFKESERPQRRSEWSPHRVVEVLADTIERGVTVRVLFLKRYPSEAELYHYGLSHDADLFFMRERDEDLYYEFRGGRRLKIIANLAMGYMVRVLVELARRTRLEDRERRAEVLRRLQIREYMSLPSVSVYIADEDVFVTPYLCKRHCSTVPAFQVGGRQSDLFKAYNGHFEAMWDVCSDLSAVDRRFVNLLVDEPDETLELYARMEVEIAERVRGEMLSNRESDQDPGHYLVEEKAIAAVLEQRFGRREQAREELKAT
jgi:hypothetical protein